MDSVEYSVLLYLETKCIYYTHPCCKVQDEIIDLVGVAKYSVAVLCINYRIRRLMPTLSMSFFSNDFILAFERRTPGGSSVACNLVSYSRFFCPSLALADIGVQNCVLWAASNSLQVYR